MTRRDFLKTTGLAMFQLNFIWLGAKRRVWITRTRGTSLTIHWSRS